MEVKILQFEDFGRAIARFAIRDFRIASKSERYLLFRVCFAYANARFARNPSPMAAFPRARRFEFTVNCK